ncbi:ribonuclease HIII [Mycoplasma sp. 1012]
MINEKIGCDETGVGDYLSPLVAAAVLIPKENLEKISLLNIKDSKKITDSKIIELTPKIKENCYFSISFLSQKQYNYLSKFLNANELKMLLHLQNINKLEKKYITNEVIIDQFSTTNSINKYINKLVNSSLQVTAIKSKLKLETKAEDKFLEVGCASIIAREFLLQKMEEQNQKWNFKFLLGATKDAKNCAFEFVTKYGFENLNQVAKINFKITEEIKENL